MASRIRHNCQVKDKERRNNNGRGIGTEATDVPARGALLGAVLTSNVCVRCDPWAFDLADRNSSDAAALLQRLQASSPPGRMSALDSQ